MSGGEARRSANLTPLRTVVDGVPVYSLDVPGPLQAMLVFRVGVVDETLPLRGITHLVEHLAMYRLAQRFAARGRINARVEALRTRFMITGSADEVTSFLSELGSSLRDLPLDRLDNEKKVLRTEAANRNGGSLKAAWSWRFGASGLGLVDFEEYGLRWLGAEAATNWAATNFTAENAVLWLSGPVPENLRLDLPHGERKALPEPRPLTCQTPALYHHGDRWVLLSILGSRDSAMYLGTRMLDSRVRERLRHERSLSYEVRAGYQRIGVSTAEVTVFADSLAPDAADAANAMVAVARDLAEHGPTRDEISGVLAERRHAREHPDAGVGVLEQSALDELEGAVRKSLEEADEEAEALTPEDVARAFASALSSSYLSVPIEVRLNLPGFTPVPASNGVRVRNGIRVEPMPGSKHSDLLEYSSEGISLTTPNQTVIVIHWRDVAAALWWADGRRTLISCDGNGINVVPARWKHAQPLLDAIRTAVPADRWVPMDEPGSVPRPAGPICSICQSSPAVEVTFQDPRSLMMIWFRRVHGVLCRDCGIAKFREIQRRVLIRGWWSIPGLVATPVALLYNMTVYYQKIRPLEVPIHSSGITPLSRGRTVWLYPGMLIPAAILAAIAVLFWPH